MEDDLDDPPTHLNYNNPDDSFDAEDAEDKRKFG